MAQDGAKPEDGGTGAQAGEPASPPGRDEVWEKFERLMQADAAAAQTAATPARRAAQPAPRPTPQVAVGAAPAFVSAPAVVAPPPRVAARAAEEAEEGAAARSARWRHRFEGAAGAAALTLLAFAAGTLHGRLTPPPETAGIAAEAAGTAAAEPDTGLETAESAVIAAIASAEPPYRVVLHVAEGVAPRDLARLDTAIGAWGFPKPERVGATDAPPLPEVRFHDDADREAARALAGVAERLFGEAVMTPPAAGGLDAALAALARSESETASDADAAPAPPRRLLELFVPAR